MSDPVKIDRAFAIFISPSYDDGEDGMWNVHVVGHELDNMTCADNPVDAVAMAHDMLQLLTETCGFPAHPDGHDYSIECQLERFDITDEDFRPTPALQCSRCDARTVKP